MKEHKTTAEPNDMGFVEMLCHGKIDWCRKEACIIADKTANTKRPSVGSSLEESLCTDSPSGKLYIANPAVWSKFHDPSQVLAQTSKLSKRALRCSTSKHQQKTSWREPTMRLYG